MTEIPDIMKHSPVTVVFGLLIPFTGILMTILWGLYTLAIVPLHDDLKDMRLDIKTIQVTVIPRPDVDRLIGELNAKIHDMNESCRERRK